MGGGAGAALVYEPCTAETRVGGFSVLLVEARGTTPAYAIISGRVRDGVYPYTYLKTDMTAGDCRLVSAPVCNPACTGGQSCGVGSQCVTEPQSKSVGTVDVTGLAIPVMGVSAIGGQYMKDLTSAPFPPFAPGDPLTLKTSGGDYASFTLAARGIEPLDFAGTGITVTRGQKLDIAWTPPAKGATGKVTATLNIAYHGGGTSQIDCEFVDDGSGEIPADLITRLIDQGTAGFPMLALTRRSVQSTTLSPPGCIEFDVSAYRERQITVCTQPGVCVVSCGQDMPCPNGTTCGNDKKCS